MLSANSRNEKDTFRNTLRMENVFPARTTDTHFKTFVPFLYGCFVVSRMRLKEVHVFLAQLVFAPEATHFDIWNNQWNIPWITIAKLSAARRYFRDKSSRNLYNLNVKIYNSRDITLFRICAMFCNSLP